MSRRGFAKVAWHVVPGKACEQARPVGNGMIERPLKEFPSKLEQMFFEIQNITKQESHMAGRSTKSNRALRAGFILHLFQALRARLPS